MDRKREGDPCHRGPLQRSWAGNQTSDQVYNRCFDLLQQVRRAHRKGRSVRLEMAPEDAAPLLMAALDIGALAVELHDRAMPDGQPLLHQLRQMGGAA